MNVTVDEDMAEGGAGHADKRRQSRAKPTKPTVEISAGEIREAELRKLALERLAQRQEQALRKAQAADSW